MKNNKPAFIVDAMLGKLAKKLRLLGYDSNYSSSIEDEQLISIAENENRILITKDYELAKKSTKQNINTIQITENDEISQLLQINEKVDLGKCDISGSNARCPLCNGILDYTEKKQVLKKVPKGVFEQTKDFWSCRNCKKIYWEGSHIRNLQKFTEKLNDKL